MVYAVIERLPAIDGHKFELLGITRVACPAVDIGAIDEYAVADIGKSTALVDDVEITGTGIAQYPFGGVITFRKLMLQDIRTALVFLAVKVECHIAVLGCERVIPVAEVLDTPLLVILAGDALQLDICAVGCGSVLDADAISEVLGQAYLIVAVRYRLNTVDRYKYPFLGIALVAGMSLDVDAVGHSAVGDIHIEAIAVDDKVRPVSGATESPVLNFLPECRACRW